MSILFIYSEIISGSTRCLKIARSKNLKLKIPSISEEIMKNWNVSPLNSSGSNTVNA